MTDFILPHSAPQSLKDFSSAFEPYGEKTQQGSELRKEGFSGADSNGTGQVSLAEVEGFIEAVLKENFSDGEDERLFRLYRPCYRHAFNNAKKLKSTGGKKLNGTKNAAGDDYINFPEFRVFTVYLRIYAAMFDIFSTADGESEGRTEDDDARIDLNEFIAQHENFSAYGFKGLQGVTSEGKAVELFDKIDTNDGGFILYTEFSKHIKKEEIAAKTKIGTLLSGNLKPRQVGSANKKSRPTSIRNGTASKKSNSGRFARKGTAGSVSSTSVRSSNRTSNASTNKKFQMIMPVKIAGAYKPRKGASSDLKKFIKSFQPYAEKQATCLALRKTEFSSCDTNGSGQCSLAEVDSFVMSVLKKDYGSVEGLKIFRLFRASYIVAYNGAKNLKANATGNDDDYVSFPEFRILNAYLCIYAGMLDCFQLVDGGGAGVDADDDRRVEKAEWINGYAEFKNSGFAALAPLNSEKSALTAFKAMDSDGQGVVRFSEFCDWIMDAEISASTSLGKLLQGSALKSRKINDDVAPPQDRSVPEPVPLPPADPEPEVDPAPEPEEEPEAPEPEDEPAPEPEEEQEVPEPEEQEQEEPEAEPEPEEEPEVPATEEEEPEEPEPGEEPEAPTPEEEEPETPAPEEEEPETPEPEETEVAPEPEEEPEVPEPDEPEVPEPEETEVAPEPEEEPEVPEPEQDAEPKEDAPEGIDAVADEKKINAE